MAYFRYPFKSFWGGGQLGEYPGLGFVGLTVDDASTDMAPVFLPGGGALDMPPIDAPGAPPADSSPPIIATSGSSIYTLPVEIFKETLPVLVHAPQPVMAPIPTELPPGYGSPAPADYSSAWIAGLAGLGLLLLGGKRRRSRRRTRDV